jgi:hypothetical protein
VQKVNRTDQSLSNKAGVSLPCDQTNKPILLGTVKTLTIERRQSLRIVTLSGSVLLRRSRRREKPDGSSILLTRVMSS